MLAAFMAQMDSIVTDGVTSASLQPVFSIAVSATSKLCREYSCSACRNTSP